MADSKISALTAVSSLAGTEVFPVVQTTTKKATVDQLYARANLYVDAANVLAMRNGANAQSLKVYTTFTDSSNYERLSVNGASLVVETAGTGTDNIDLTLTPAGTGVLRFGTRSAIAGETLNGYITIKDSGGTSRKLAVVQ